MALFTKATVAEIEAEYGTCNVKGCGRILEAYGCPVHARSTLERSVKGWEESVDALTGDYPPELTKAERFTLGLYGTMKGQHHWSDEEVDAWNSAKRGSGVQLKHGHVDPF